ncbi:DUF1214 domain-containing protein [Azoarcus sp. DN11]|uniref:DUF1214 domain-containing protein n=1 Tax=Azoarcus sp. DN11 TaxID=356837 RepID=UPI000EB0D2C1|nr:DUF1214 domain-containing protein [Azoarcus sp. DN11]AYH42909.1 hypothetical protein CDA09_05845 [Azoarcus sp. DN11]
MKVVRLRPTHLAVAVALLAPLGSPAVAASNPAPAARSPTAGHPLATAQQRELEERALRVLASPEVAAQKALARKLFAAEATAATPDGRVTLDPALDELVLATIYEVVNDDAANPKVLWIETPQHNWFGKTVPGARYGIDNPDNAYRSIPIDATGRYEIKGRRSKDGPVQVSFQLYTDATEENRSKLDAPLGGLIDRQIEVQPDGSYTITIDSEPANGRPNHIRSTPDTKSLLVRNTFSDWTVQTPDAVEVKRVSGPAASPADDRLLAQRAAERLKTAVPFWLKFNREWGTSAAGINQVPQPFARGGGWGFATGGKFRLAADEALVITVHPQSARYVGFQLTDPWARSRNYITRSGSLNNTQAKPNADGSYTYVIAARDPGVHNWLDTDGLHSGSFLIRWQAFPEGVASTDGAVRDARVVKLAELGSALPPDTAKVGSAERRSLLSARAAGFARRLPN